VPRKKFMAMMARPWKYIYFLELMIPNLLTVAEESRIHGFIYGSINAKIIALIPKTLNPSSFAEYKPISLSNSVYKLILKLLQTSLKLLCRSTLHLKSSNHYPNPVRRRNMERDT